MKKLALIFAFMPLALGLSAQSSWNGGSLLDKTLRIDYMFSGTSRTSRVAVAELLSLEGWHGRRVNLKQVPVAGNGSLVMTDAASGDTLYCNSFSTLFQEWQATEEATKVERSFENVFLVPMPAKPAKVTLSLYNLRREVVCTNDFVVNPSDILIRPVTSEVAYSYIHKAGDTKGCIDVVILAEGYTKEEMNVFYADAKATVDAMFEHEPFAHMKDRFNFVAVAAESADSGVSVPGRGEWKNTPVNSHFNTFYSDRYLTTLHLRDLHNILAGVPYEHIIILANTDTYGGGGIYNSYTLTTAHHEDFRPVVVHEFGHSFGALADEYYYDDQYENYYCSDVEPWEQNITTKVDFACKWQDMMNQKGVGLFEGGGYMSKGVWRPAHNCRMKTNAAPAFCPVCQRAITRIIDFNTKQQ